MGKIRPGDKIPKFTLRNQENEELVVDPDKGGARIIYFYPKNNTKFCIEEACTFRDWRDDLVEKGFEVIGISSDRPSSHNKFSARHRLNFNLLSDPRSKIRNLFGASYLFGLIPARYTYIINKKGIVQDVFKGLLKGKEHVLYALDRISEQKED